MIYVCIHNFLPFFFVCKDNSLYVDVIMENMKTYWKMQHNDGITSTAHKDTHTCTV